MTALEEAETFAVVKGEFDRLRGNIRRQRRPLAFLAGELGRQHELLLEALYLPVDNGCSAGLSSSAASTRTVSCR